MGLGLIGSIALRDVCPPEWSIEGLRGVRGVRVAGFFSLLRKSLALPSDFGPSPCGRTKEAMAGTRAECELSVPGFGGLVFRV